MGLVSAFAAVASLLAIISALETAAGVQHWLTTWVPLLALTWLAVRETGVVADDQRTISSSPTTPKHMLPSTMKHSPPNILRSDNPV